MCRSISSRLSKEIRLLSAIRGSFLGRDIPTILERSLFNLVSLPYRSLINLLTYQAIFMIAVSPAASGDVTGQAYNALYATILGAFFLTILLLFVSGLTLQERPGAKKRYEKDNHWEEYSRYLNRTSILIPFPPQIYSKLPTILKRTIFLEFPIYVFDPAKHSDGGKGSAAAEEGQSNPGNAHNNHRESGDHLVEEQRTGNQ